jgi:ELWxxDGT repeat protein
VEQFKYPFMKHTLHVLTLFTFTLLTLKSQSQVTLISDNTNIRYGVALGSIGVLADKNGALWSTDGTPGNTSIYTTKVLIDSPARQIMWNNKIYFNGISATYGKELWVTDGTDLGTSLVKDINTGSASSSPENFIVFNNALYFFATTAANGTELWKTDGSNAGTVLLKDINPGTVGSYDSTYTSFFISNNILYFDANDGTHGTELWKTDGTGTGTVMVQDINPGAASSNCENFATLGTNMLFAATDVAHGTELWKTNGLGGAFLVEDIASGADSSSPSQLIMFNGKVIFTAVSSFFGFPIEHLYSTDGTASGTIVLKDFALGVAAFLSNSVFINNKMYFAVIDFFSGGGALWSSDGTQTGTQLFDNINNSVPLILPDFQSLINGSTDVHTKLFNGKIFFVADDSIHGQELWITDGVDSTSAHTHMVKDIAPGAASSITGDSATSSWFYTANSFYFPANDGTTGNELYVSDGTEANTVLVKDINPGTASSNPFLFMLLNNHLYFTADNGDDPGNRDLFIVDAETPLPVSLLSFGASLNSKDVDLLWTTVTENNTKNFVVQRSPDAVHFTNIGTVNAAGYSAGKINYTFIDAGAFNAGANTLYYRLQMVDKDGKFSYSKIASVQMLPNGKLIVVYPNPVKDKLVVVANNALSSAVIKVTDQSGKIILTQRLENVQAGTMNTINVSTLSSGVYYLQVISNDNKQTTQFIKY